MNRCHGAVICFSLFSLLPSAVDAAEVPAGTVLEVRLEQEIASYSSKTGSAVQGVLIAPVRVAEKTLLPVGAKISGILGSVHRVGIGFIHESASFEVQWNRLELPNGSSFDIQGQTTEIDNARERVDSKGRIHGIRPTTAIGYQATDWISAVAIVDPILYMFTTASSLSLLSMAEPEIVFPAGTELFVKLSEPLEVAELAISPLPLVTQSQQESQELNQFIRALPFRTSTEKGGKPSDLTNLLFLGSEDAIQRAFQAAGWVDADPLTSRSTYLTLRSIAGQQNYQKAPMSTLLLGGNPPKYALSKTLNTFSKRHHLRIWSLASSWNGSQVWTASSTHDSGIGFSKKSGTFIHLIDENIDNERAKIVNDIIFAGCVDALQLVQRPWVPSGIKNGTGQELITDKAIAVLKLNRCESPREAHQAIAPPPGPQRPNKTLRGTREVVLGVKNELIRGNVIWLGYKGISYLVKKNQPSYVPPREFDVDQDTFSQVHISPEPVEISTTPVQAAQPAGAPASRLPSPHIELSFLAGYLRYPTESAGSVVFEAIPADPAQKPLTVLLGNILRPGWTLGGTVTFNTHRYISHELGFHYQKGTFKLLALDLTEGGTELPDVSFDTENVGMVTRQVSYSTVFHLRPREARIRPYIAAGPALQLLNLSDAPVRRAGGIFRFGLSNIGMIRSAWDFERTPPLEGGGIFQVAFQYGGGVKWQVTPHWMARFDFRETLASQPDFFSKSLPPGEQSDQDGTLKIFPVDLSGKMRQQRFSIGFSYTF